jgi:hypothetical protein
MSLEAADDVALGLAFRLAPGRIGLGLLVAREPDHGDAPQGMVGLAIARSVESVPDSHARGGLDRRHPAHGGEGCLVAQAFGVATGGDEQNGGHVGPHAQGGAQSRIGLGRQIIEDGAEFTISSLSAS